MNKIAQFHKVSFEQFKESWDDSFPGASEEEIKEIYDQIKLPKRATRRFQQESEFLLNLIGY